MPQPASTGGGATCSEDTPGAVICTLDGLARAAFTSRRILGSGPSLEAALWEKGVKADQRAEDECPAARVKIPPPLRLQRGGGASLCNAVVNYGFTIRKTVTRETHSEELQFSPNTPSHRSFLER